MKGRKPKPSAIKRLTGNPGHRALNAREPKPEIAIPTCPNHLTGVARQEWRRIVKRLHKLGMISHLDRAVLAAYCSAYADFAEATNELKKQGKVVITAKGELQQNPWVKIKQKAMDQVNRFGAEFGMSPSSRARVMTDKPTEEDAMASFLFQKPVKVK